MAWSLILLLRRRRAGDCSYSRHPLKKTLKIFYRCGEVMTEATLKELGEANWKARLAAMEEVLD